MNSISKSPFLMFNSLIDLLIFSSKTLLLFTLISWSHVPLSAQGPLGSEAPGLFLRDLLVGIPALPLSERPLGVPFNLSVSRFSCGLHNSPQDSVCQIAGTGLACRWCSLVA